MDEASSVLRDPISSVRPELVEGWYAYAAAEGATAARFCRVWVVLTSARHTG